MLSFIIFLPIAGVAAILLLPRERESWAKWIAAGVGTVILALTLTLFAAYDRGPGGFQFVDSTIWLESDFVEFTLRYAVGVDGLSLALVTLTGFLFLVAVLTSWRIELRPKEYFAWILLLETSLLGVFSALDLVMFFLFWVVLMIPMYFLLSIWVTGR